MCGITGMLRLDGLSVEPDELAAFTRALQHRGPDDSGMYIDGPVGLGHQRLAIIDLEGGRQPLANEDETIWVVCNGEIYNFRELTRELTALGHRFKTRSDTEVLVHAYEQWGERCLDRFRGMFAFAIWDSRLRRLFLARDRLGIKPLCYMVNGEVIVFASELGAFRTLRDFHPSLNLQALDLYLHYQYIPAPFSIYNEVQKLPPAHYLIMQADGRTTGPKRYWDLVFQPDFRLTENEWIELLDAGLRETIRLHLVSDVPFGAFLSGGVDSGAVVAYMRQMMAPAVRTFTVGYKESEFDERQYAREVADRLGTEHKEEVLEPEALNILPTLAKHYGEPFGDDSAICTYYVSQIAARDVKMVVSGDGGDEVFAGYRYFGRMMRSLSRLGNNARPFIPGLPATQPPPDLIRGAWYNRTAYIGEELRERLWHPEYRYLLEGTRAWNDRQFDPVSHADSLSQYQYVDIHNYLPYNNLCKMDIASMCHGIEVRVPLLDHVFLEQLAALPPEMRLMPVNGTSKMALGASKEGYILKYILKKTAEQFFDPGFLSRKKRGFSVPVTDWFAGPYHREIKSRLSNSSQRLGQFFDLKLIGKLVDNHRTERGHGQQLWMLLFLDEWMKQSAQSRA